MKIRHYPSTLRGLPSPSGSRLPRRALPCAVLAMTLSWLSLGPIDAQSPAGPGAPTEPAPNPLESVVTALVDQLQGATALTQEAGGEDLARRLIVVHSTLPAADLDATARPLAELAAPALTARILLQDLSAVLTALDDGASIPGLVLEADLEPQVAFYRFYLLTAAMNFHAFTVIEGSADSDGDGVINTLDYDVDGDGVDNGFDDDIDGDEVPNTEDLDMDGDGLLNLLDDDVDGDGLMNLDDQDIDGDQISNYEDLDEDGDGFPDEIDSTIGPGLPTWVDTLSAGQALRGGTNDPPVDDSGGSGDNSGSSGNSGPGSSGSDDDDDSDSDDDNSGPGPNSGSGSDDDDDDSDDSSGSGSGGSGGGGNNDDDDDDSDDNSGSGSGSSGSGGNDDDDDDD